MVIKTALLLLIFQSDTVTYVGNSNKLVVQEGSVKDLAMPNVTVQIRGGNINYETSLSVNQVKKITFYPYSFKGELRTAIKYFNEEDFKNAISTFLDAQNQKSASDLEDQIKLFLLAQAYLNVNDYDKAKEFCKKYLDTYPKTYPSLVCSAALAEISVNLGNAQEAGKYLKNLKTLVGSPEKSYWKIQSDLIEGDIAALEGNFDKADTKYQFLIREGYEDVREMALLKSFVISRDQKKWNNIKDLFERVKLFPEIELRTREVAYESLGEYFFNSRMYGEAIEYFLKVLLLYNRGLNQEHERSLGHLIICIKEHLKSVQDEKMKNFYKSKAQQYFRTLKSKYPKSKWIEKTEKILEELS